MPALEGFIPIGSGEILTPALVTRRLQLGKKIIKLSDLAPEHECLVIAFLLDKIRDAKKAYSKLAAMEKSGGHDTIAKNMVYWSNYISACRHMLGQTSCGKDVLDAFNL